MQQDDLQGRLSYSPREAAAVTGIPVGVIQKAYLSGDLVAYRRSPRRPVIFHDDLIAWIKAAPTERASA
jgi:hypothetical protein